MIGRASGTSVRAALLAAGGLLVVACSVPAGMPAPPTAPPAGSAAVVPTATTREVPRQLQALKTAYPTTAATMAPLWLARDQGLFAQQGLDVDMALVTSGPTLMGAILSGETPIAMSGANQPIEASLQGADYLILGSTMPYMPNAVYVHPSIESPEGLRGKVLGTSSYGSITHIALRAAFEQ